MMTFTDALANLPNDRPVADWWFAHWSTQLIEMPIYIVLLWWAFRRWWVVIPLSVIVNITTHPTLWFLFPDWTVDGTWLLPLLPTESLKQSAAYFTWLIIAECGVFIIEGHMVAATLVVAGRGQYRAPGFAICYGLFAAFVANVPSTLAGLLA